MIAVHAPSATIARVLLDCGTEQKDQVKFLAELGRFPKYKMAFSHSKFPRSEDLTILQSSLMNYIVSVQTEILSADDNSGSKMLKSVKFTLSHEQLGSQQPYPVFEGNERRGGEAELQPRTCYLREGKEIVGCLAIGIGLWKASPPAPPYPRYRSFSQLFHSPRSTPRSASSSSLKKPFIRASLSHLPIESITSNQPP